MFNVKEHYLKLTIKSKPLNIYLLPCDQNQTFDI